METMINWFSIPSTDFERAVAFYSKIFGIEMKKDKGPKGDDLAYFLDPQKGDISGAVVASADQKPGVDGALIYLNANGKLDEVIARVEEAGGKVAMPNTDIGEHGNIAMIMDTEGNLVGLHSAKQ